MKKIYIKRTILWDKISLFHLSYLIFICLFATSACSDDFIEETERASCESTKASSIDAVYYRCNFCDREGDGPLPGSCLLCGRKSFEYLSRYDYQIFCNAISTLNSIFYNEISRHACPKLNCKGKNIDLVRKAFLNNYDAGGSGVIGQLAIFTNNFASEINKSSCMFMVNEMPGSLMVITNLSRGDQFAFQAVEKAIEELCGSTTTTDPELPVDPPLNPGNDPRFEDVDLFDANKFVGYNVSGSTREGALEIAKNYDINCYSKFLENMLPMIGYVNQDDYSGITYLNYEDYKNRMNIVDEALNAGCPVIVKGKTEYISRFMQDDDSDYFLVIVGRRYDEVSDKYFYRYMDPSKSDSSGYSSSNVLFERGREDEGMFLLSDNYMIVGIFEPIYW